MVNFLIKCNLILEVGVTVDLGKILGIENILIQLIKIKHY